MDAEALARAAELVKDRPGAAQLCVLQHGEVVLDLSIRCEPESLFLLWSTGKPYTAMAVHLLAERGMLDLDDPVRRFWPEYAQGGKADVTVRHVLRHASGAPLSTGSVLGDALASPFWDLSVRAAARAKVRYPVGVMSVYHILSHGFVLGELVRRVDGRPLRRFLRQELLDPAGLRDTHLGLTGELWPRNMRLLAPPRGTPDAPGAGDRAKLELFDRKAVRMSVIPAATMHATARDVARFYQLLLNEGELDGTRLFDPKTIASARRPAAEAGRREPDRIIGHPVRWAHGFQLGWGDLSIRTARPFGTTAGRSVFGHNGSNYCNAWADPDNDLVVAYLTNLVPRRAAALARQTELSDLVRSACATSDA
ncbi:MAG TPA: serine hydrolase domain-containing protein [Actinospica sp.]|nr:serine hydrolase domain-containing protein [Actinospica sp.]